MLDNARTYIVPIMNVDGFVTSRTAAAEPAGRPAGDAGHAAADRRRRRLPPQELPAALSPVEDDVPCQARQQNDNGVDPNRNYGENVGRARARAACRTTSPTTARGRSPSPRRRRSAQLLLGLQPTVLITNHTFTGLILRPPGLSDEGLAPDEDRMRQLGDAMARETDYISQYGWQLYDTTGTTDDWLYGGLGSFSYTPEIGKTNFHPNYTNDFVPEYDGTQEIDKNTGEPTGRKLGGLREAYLLAGETAIAPDSHSILQGQAPAGRVLRLQRDFVTTTSARPNDDGVAAPDPAARRAPRVDADGAGRTAASSGTSRRRRGPSSRDRSRGR